MKTYLINSAMATALAFITLSPAPAFAGGGNVQPSTAKPKGYSLTVMAEKLARFSTSGNSPLEYPHDTPFQILYSSETNVFHVKTGTHFFVPVSFVSDSAPILGTFPTEASTAAEVQAYFFDKAQLGVRDLAIEVDGKVTPIGRNYLAGPVSTPNLPDGGSHFIQVGAFLTPFSKGTHTVTIRGVFDGDLLIPFFPPGTLPIVFAITYTVIVE